MVTTWMSLALSGAMRQQMRFLIERKCVGVTEKTLNEPTNLSPKCKKLSLPQFSHSFTKGTELNSPVEVSWDHL